MVKNKEVSSLVSQYMANTISTAYYVPLKLSLFKIHQIFIGCLFSFIKNEQNRHNHWPQGTYNLDSNESNENRTINRKSTLVTKRVPIISFHLQSQTIFFLPYIKNEKTWLQTTSLSFLKN